MSYDPLIQCLLSGIADSKAARTMGTFGGFYVFPPAVKADLQTAGWRLGFDLSGLLRELYLKVGNGGFGPGYGLFGIAGGAPAINRGGQRLELVSNYQLYTQGLARRGR